jgi:hypothetical protein
MGWADNHSPSGYPVFVVWRMVWKDGEAIWKSRVVVDVRPANKLAVPDIYPMPLQAEIIAMLAGKQYITVIDAVAFFHRWKVWGPHRNRLTVVSHRGQEVLNCVPMGFINSVAFVQRQLDNKLRKHRLYCRSYIDDILIASKTLEEHEKHLDEVFQDLENLRVCLAPEKAYIGYPSVKLLGQRVDGLGMSTTDEKLKALVDLKFPTTLSQLETYLGMAGYLRNYVSRFAQIVEPLEDRKRSLMKPGPKAGKARKAFARAAQVAEPTAKELQAFNTLQSIFGSPQTLVHHDPLRPLFIDLDAAKGDGGFGGMVYHVEGDLGFMKPHEKMVPPPRTKVRPILFLSRILNVHERNYWPTELEVACLVWILRKVRHIVEASREAVIVWTDHAATIAIAKQTSLTTSSTDKLNLRLVQAAAYIQRFRLSIYHKPGKDNIVPDALSRLPTNKPVVEPDSILDTLFTEPVYAFNTLLVEMDSGFKKALMDGYESDPHWKDILMAVQKNLAKDEADRTELPYEIDDGLLYSVNHLDERRLVIPDSQVAEIFKHAHDNANHAGFRRAFENLHGITIRRMRRQLEDYIRACPHCKANQTRRHKPYGDLQPIMAPPIPFHTICIDFILALPVSVEGFDAALTCTDKFTKSVEIIPGKSTWSANEWGAAVANRLLLVGWGIPMVFLSDRDSKFLSEFWAAIFGDLKVKMLLAAAYHSQTDGASERTNQTVEIALRYYFAALDDPRRWTEIIPMLQAAIASTVSAATGHTPNELKFGINTVRALDGINPHLQRIQDFTVRIDAAESISMAQMAMKKFYDTHHKPKSFAVGDKVLLRLHKGYNIPTVTNPKLAPQYVGPFKVLERVGRLAYRLELPGHWQVHPVISIAHLEPSNPDPYGRPQPDHPDSVHVEGDTEEYKSFEVDRLIDKRIVTRRGKKNVEYLIRWKGYGPEYDQWYHTDNLDSCKELIEAYERLQRPVREVQPRAARKKRQTTAAERPADSTAATIATTDTALPRAASPIDKALPGTAPPGDKAPPNVTIDREPHLAPNHAPRRSDRLLARLVDKMKTARG